MAIQFLMRKQSCTSPGTPAYECDVFSAFAKWASKEDSEAVIHAAPEPGKD